MAVPQSWCRQALYWKPLSAVPALARETRRQTMRFQSATRRGISRTARARNSRAGRLRQWHWWTRARLQRQRQTRDISRRLQTLTVILQSTNISLTKRFMRTVCLIPRALRTSLSRFSLDQTSRTGLRWWRWPTIWCSRWSQRFMILSQPQMSWFLPGRLPLTAPILSVLQSLHSPARTRTMCVLPKRFRRRRRRARRKSALCRSLRNWRRHGLWWKPSRRMRTAAIPALEAQSLQWSRGTARRESRRQAARRCLAAGRISQTSMRPSATARTWSTGECCHFSSKKASCRSKISTISTFRASGGLWRRRQKWSRHTSWAALRVSARKQSLRWRSESLPTRSGRLSSKDVSLIIIEYKPEKSRAAARDFCCNSIVFS